MLHSSLSVEELAHVVENIDLFRTVCAWILSYLARPHAQLGRSGNVCPFAAPALARDALRIAVIRLNPESDKRMQILHAIQHHRQAFRSLIRAGETHILHSTLVVFPDVCPEEAPDLIDRTKEELKTSFVQEGLMLGEFHSRNESPGLHNPSFQPLRSPVPMLVIRRMVATDYVFLNRSEYGAATRLQYLESYLESSGIPDSPGRREAELVIASLKEELRNESAKRPLDAASISAISSRALQA